MRRLLYMALLVALAPACSHNSPRENPLDPALTPPVELRASLSDSTGAVTLTWSPYDGQQPLSHYILQRKVQGQEGWSSLDTLASSRTTYVDHSLNPVTAYDYRVVVVNTDGTFTYDPTTGAGLQELGTAKPSTNDTFSYTVTDAIGKTDSATVTISVAGIEDTFAATDNYLDDTGLNELSSKAFTVDLTQNDGIAGTANGTTNDILVLNYDAAASAGTTY